MLQYNQNCNSGEVRVQTNAGQYWTELKLLNSVQQKWLFFRNENKVIGYCCYF